MATASPPPTANDHGEDATQPEPETPVAAATTTATVINGTSQKRRAEDLEMESDDVTTPKRARVQEDEIGSSPTKEEDTGESKKDDGDEDENSKSGKEEQEDEIDNDDVKAQAQKERDVLLSRGRLVLSGPANNQRWRGRVYSLTEPVPNLLSNLTIPFFHIKLIKEPKITSL